MACMAPYVTQRPDITVVPGRKDFCFIGSRVAVPLSGTVYTKYSRVSLQFPLIVVTGTPDNFFLSKKALVDFYGSV